MGRVRGFKELVQIIMNKYWYSTQNGVIHEAMVSHSHIILFEIAVEMKRAFSSAVTVTSAVVTLVAAAALALADVTGAFDWVTYYEKIHNMS